MKKKFNIVDAVIILLVLCAVGFFGWKFIGGSGYEANYQEITCTVVTEAVPLESYEDIMKHVPGQLVISGSLANGEVTSVAAEPVKATEIKRGNASDNCISIEPIHEYVSLTFTVKMSVDLNDLATSFGTQEVRTGRSYIVKTQFFEYTGIITTIDRP